MSSLSALTTEDVVDERVNFSHFVLVIKLDIHGRRLEELSGFGKLAEVPHDAIALVRHAQTKFFLAIAQRLDEIAVGVGRDWRVDLHGYLVT